jgi:hypothetical protein
MQIGDLTITIYLIPNNGLTPHDIRAMGLIEFRNRFGFRPADALEKDWFIANGRRIDSACRAVIESGALGELDYSAINMDD